MIKKYPSFSVLVSVYKNDKPSYLDKALESIENQSVKPSEIVLVEDGTIPIGLTNVIVKHQDKMGKMFKNIKSKKNQGLGSSLRLGTKYVSTDWIARMDSDDISVSDRFEKQLNEIIKNPKLAIVGGQVKEFAGSESSIVGQRRVPLSYKKIKKFMKWRSPFNHPTVIINKEKLIKVGGYIPYGNLEDYYLWARMIIKGYQVCNISDFILYMRADEGMYQRRGKLSNLKYFYRLREFLYKHKVLTLQERYIGNIIMTINILVPGWIRKLIYQYMLHI